LPIDFFLNLKSQDSHARNAQCIFTTAARSNGAVGLTLKQNAIRISHVYVWC